MTANTKPAMTTSTAPVAGAFEATRPDDAFERALRLVYAFADECVADGHVSTFTGSHVRMVNAITAIEREALAARSAPVVAESQWISVEDRLPTKYCEVWIANFDDVQRALWSDVDREFLVKDVYGAYEKAFGVTHWMLHVIPAHPTVGSGSAQEGQAK